MAVTTWTQVAGMASVEDTDNIESYSEQAKASKDAAAASAAAAALSETAAETAETNAETAETNAETAETNASSSATAAASSATSAAGSATAASASETAAATSETNAATSETNAATSETNAATSATAAASSATSAQASKDAALAALDNFDDRYLGQKASDPTVDNDGDALIAGALYFNSTDDVMKVYEGSLWVAAYASLSGALLSANNLSDLANASAARTNLGLGTAATTASSDYATAAQGTLADSAVQPNDSPSFGSITVTGTVDGRDIAADGTKLDGIEASADVTDTANVTSAGALMDSEVVNLAQVKAFDSGDYATAAQGTLADSAVQPNDSPTFGAVTATSYAGDGSALTGLPAGYTDADVDAHLNYSTATSGQVLSYSGSDYDWVDAEFVQVSGDTMTGDLNVTGTLTADNISDGTDTVETGYVVNGSAKAWVNFNGTGTIAERDSLNVSTLTDNGTGKYVVNFSNAFGASDNYSFNFNFGTTAGATVNSARAVSTNITASSIGCEVGNFQAGATNGYNDVEYVTGLFHGDLA